MERDSCWLQKDQADRYPKLASCHIVWSSRVTRDGIGEVDRPNGDVNGFEGGLKDLPGDSLV